MKLVNIPGKKYLDLYREYSDYAFCLAHFARDDPAYMKWFQEYDGPIIMDNGAAELGKSVDVDEFISLMRQVRGNKKTFFEIWCPDDLYDCHKSLSMTNQFINKLTDEERANISLVGIPQGKNLQEFLFAYESLRLNPHIKVIALSKYSVPECFKEIGDGRDELAYNRGNALMYLFSNGLMTKPLHLAGANNYLLKELVFARDFNMVRSIDSNIAFKLAVHNIDIDNALTEPEARLDHDIEISPTTMLKVVNNMVKALEQREEEIEEYYEDKDDLEEYDTE